MSITHMVTLINTLIIELNLKNIKYNVNSYTIILNITLSSKYDIENTQLMLIIHIWYARPTSWPPTKVVQLIALFSNSEHFFI